MKIVIQRVGSASVSVSGQVVSSITHGLMCLVGISTEDGQDDVEYCAKKIASIRLFDSNIGDENVEIFPGTATAVQNTESAGKDVKGWAKNVLDAKGSLLMVSQFTLCHSLKKPKPDFHRAMGGAGAQLLFDSLVKLLKDSFAIEYDKKHSIQKSGKSAAKQNRLNQTDQKQSDINNEPAESAQNIENEEKDSESLLTSLPPVESKELSKTCSTKVEPENTNQTEAGEPPVVYPHMKERADYLSSKVQVGVFGAHMQVQLMNDGPVTIVLDSKNRD